LLPMLWDRKRLLWGPIPAVGTHLQYDEIGPGVDWIAIWDTAGELCKTRGSLLAEPRNAGS
jgi:hypothetical protein